MSAVAARGDAPEVILTVNNSWNILNFRADLVRGLLAAGYRVGVVSPADAHAAALADLGVAHYPLAIDSKGLSPVGDLRLFAGYLRILRARRPVALLGWTIKPNIYGSAAAHLLGIPVVNNVSGLGTAFMRPGPLQRLVVVLYRVGLARSATVFFQNPDDETLFVERGIIAAARSERLPGSGIDLTRFTPSATAAGAAGGTFTFLLVARLLRDKGIGEFVEAARRLRARHPGVRFALMGGVDADKSTAIDRATLSGWIDEGCITYLGETADVRPAMAAADCIVLPSYREGMPRALLEGAALGRPLIATRVPGCVEIARDGENALLCEPRDAASLADAMARMLALPAATRRAMGAAGRRIAEAEFDQRIVTDRYLAALRRALTPVTA